MKLKTFVQCLAALAIITLGWVMWPGRKRHSGEQANPPSASTKVTEVPGLLGTMSSESQPANPFWRRMAGESQWATPPLSEVRVNTAQVLAMVNQTPVRLRDLMPIRPGETEKDLTPEQYASRLQRAIDMELTFQAARAQGVELTPAQQQRLEQTAPRHQSDLTHYRNYGLSWSSISPEQVEFEKRLLTAQLLEQNLVARKSAVFPSPDPQMQARYERARRAILAQLQASAVPAL